MSNENSNEISMAARSTWRLDDNRAVVALAITAVILLIYCQPESWTPLVAFSLKAIGGFLLDCVILLVRAIASIVSACRQAGLGSLLLLAGAACYGHDAVAAVWRIGKAARAADRAACSCATFRAALEEGDQAACRGLAGKMTASEDVVARLAAAVYRRELTPKEALEYGQQCLASGLTLFGILEEGSPLLVATISYAKIGFLMQCIATGVQGLVQQAEAGFGHRLVLSSYGIGLALLAVITRALVETSLPGHLSRLEGLLDCIDRSRQKEVFQRMLSDLSDSLQVCIETSVARALESGRQPYTTVPTLADDAFEPGQHTQPVVAHSDPSWFQKIAGGGDRR